MDLLTSSTSYSQGDHTWLGSAHGTDENETITLDLTQFTKATQFPDGYIPSGMTLGIVAVGGLYAPYDGAAVDGTETSVGHLYGDVPVSNDDGILGVGVALGALFNHGKVILANLPAGDAIDAAGQADLPSVLYR